MMYVAWLDTAPASSGESAVRDEARTTSLRVGTTVLVWNAANEWRIPVANVPGEAWPLLPLVGGLALVDDSGEPIVDGSIPATRPEVP